jgi:hypothetical protein
VNVRLFLAMIAVLALAVGVTVVVYDQLDVGGDGGDQVVSGPGGSGGEDDPVIGEGAAPDLVPGPGQVFVRGTVTTVLIADAVLEPREMPVPLTISSERGFGNGGEVTSAQVDGEPSTIVWDGGTPFVLSSGGSLLLDPVDLALVDGGLQAVLGRGNHALTPGTYQLDTSVAVGTEGVATPRDSVTFDAVEGTLFEARGDASILFGPDAPRRFVGPGTVLLAGTLEITDPDGTRTEESLVTQVAAFDLTFTPDGAGGWTVEGIVDQPAQPTLPAS